MMEKIKIKFLRPRAQMPTYGTEYAAGADLYACLEDTVTIQPGETVKIPIGIALELPENTAGLIFARSSLGTKRGLAPANKVGVIDPDYRGEVMVMLHNHSKTEAQIAPGERVAQLLVVPVFTPGFIAADTLSDTVRGEGGFGSTGK